MLEITISSAAPNFSQEHILFGRNYILEFEWIEREKSWVMHCYDGLEQPIALGLRVSTGWPILVDEKTGMILLLLSKIPNAELNLKSFHKDFVVIAHESV
jgi:hypothetical protein